MGNIVLSLNPQDKKKQQKPTTARKRIPLIHHDGIVGHPETYTYIADDGKEKVFDDSSYKILKVSSSKYIAKKTSVVKVPLEVVDSRDPIEYKPGYFTYISLNGEQMRYLDRATYDNEDCSYHGTLKQTIMHDKEVKLLEA